MTLSENVTIATAAHGNAAVTALCLNAILSSAVGEFELLLIDDCSPDAPEIRGLYAEAKRRHANTKIFRFDENLEYTGSVNAVLSHARGDWIFFISNDIFITPIYVRMLLELAQENPRIGIIRGSSNFVDNGLPTHNVLPTKPITNLTELFDAGSAFAEQFGRITQPDPFLVGDAFMVTRQLLERIGTFDPNFFGYFGDPDFGLRARIAEFETRLAPGAFAYHMRKANFDYLPEAARKAKLDRRWMRVFENWARFKMKYGLPVAAPYIGIASIGWDALATRAFDWRVHYSAPADYSRHLVAS